MKRWTKEAKKGTIDYEQDNHSSVNAKETEIVWRNSMLCIANTIISKSQGDDSLKSICQKILLGLDEKIERESSKLGSNANLEENEVVEHNIVDEMLGLSNHVSVLNPPCVRSKGLRKDRLKGHFEKRKAKSSKDASSSRKKFFFFFILNICHIFIFNKNFYLRLLLCLIFLMCNFIGKEKKNKFLKKIQMCHSVAHTIQLYTNHQIPTLI